MGDILGKPTRVPLKVALEAAKKERNTAKQRPSGFKQEWYSDEGWGGTPVILLGKLNTTSKWWHGDTCWCANGKCERCPAKDCADRDWRKRMKSV